MTASKCFFTRPFRSSIGYRSGSPLKRGRTCICNDDHGLSGDTAVFVRDSTTLIKDGAVSDRDDAEATAVKLEVLALLV
jgi:hypothetical protein